MSLPLLPQRLVGLLWPAALSETTCRREERGQADLGTRDRGAVVTGEARALIQVRWGVWDLWVSQSQGRMYVAARVDPAFRKLRAARVRAG